MKAIKHPAPCVATAESAIAVLFNMTCVWFVWDAAVMRFEAKGAVRSRG